MPALLFLALASSKSVTDRLVHGVFDNTFAGIHHLAWFDWAMLIPYFTVLMVLSVYGLHRYEVIRTYFKHRKKDTGIIPENIRTQVDQDKALFGDYLVCPFTKPKENEMQMVCIEKVTNLVVKKR